MARRDAFVGYHPCVNFIFYALVLVFSMCLMHPAYLLASFCGAAGYCARVQGGARVRRTLLYLLPMMLLAAILNPAFNHEGVTILAYLPSGNPLTLESLYYGAAAAVMLGCVVLWFVSFNAVMTSDKFVYLFGRVIPALSLVLSMTLRFVPRFAAQYRRVRQAQKALGRGERGFFGRVRAFAAVVSTMITWSLENALDTADSMRSRGYGLPGRTSFSIYRFTDRDRAALLLILGLGFFVAAGWIGGGMAFRYYPAVHAGEVTVWSVSFLFAYAALCLMPLILDWGEDFAWRAMRSAS